MRQLAAPKEDSSADTPPLRLLLTAEEAAAALGISERTLLTMKKAGKIRALRVHDRCIRYDPRDLSEFVDRLRAEPQLAASG